MAESDATPKISDMEERPVKAALESRPSQTSNLEAFEIGLRLDQMINGMESILTRMDRQDEQARLLADQLERVRARLDKMQRAVELWETEQDKIRQISQEASDNVDPQVRAKAQADASKAVSNLTAALRVNGNLQRAQFIEALKNSPQVEVTSPGRIVFASGPQGTMVPQLLADRVGINGFTWVFQPNRPTKVPKIVADRYYEMKQEEALLAQRKFMLSASNKGKLREEDSLAKEWDRVNTEFNSPTDPFPLAGGS